MQKRIFPLALVPLALWGGNISYAIAADNGLQDVEVKMKSSDDGNATNNSSNQTSAKKADAVVAAEHIEVTGSRLQHGDITSRQTIITADDIKASGVSSVEDLIRTLPQNVSNIGTITNERSRGPLSDREAPVSALGQLGVSAANLGGMGAGQTLVLINGHRVAGAAGIEDGFVNLNGIPLTAIERVEISLDGASAIYGSDAMGGVINFILKKGYSTSSVAVQHLDSSNDADKNRISLYSGTGWSTGSISATVEYTKQKPVNNWKSGYVTENYADYYDGNPQYDNRSFLNGAQPGVIPDDQYIIHDDGSYEVIHQALTVPDGFTGRPTMDDMITVGEEALRDYVPEYASSDTDSLSVTLNIDQELTDHLSFFANGLYTRNKNDKELDYNQGLSLQLAPGQYYNPYPAYYFGTYSPYTTVNYYPQAELNAGRLPKGRIKGTTTDWSLNTGLTYEFNKDTKLDFVYTTSRSTTEADEAIFSSAVQFIEDPDSPNGISCYSYQLANSQLNSKERRSIQAAFDRQCELLTSSDPDVAFNPWNSSAQGPGADINNFYYTSESETRGSKMENYELRLNGSLYQLPAGKAYYVVGGEYSNNGVNSKEVNTYTGGGIERDHYAGFAELSLSIFGGDFTLPGFQRLTFDLAARRDIYKTKGAVGTVDGVPIDQGGEIIYDENRFSRTTPSYGFFWEPITGLSFRGKMTEGFQAPPFTQLFNVTGSFHYQSAIIGDPIYDCTANDSCDYSGIEGAYAAPNITRPNPDLKPQTSRQKTLSVSWTPQGVLAGLSFAATWHKTVRKNEYADLQDMYYLLPPDEIYQLEIFYPRDETGRITQVNSVQTNISGSTFESMTYELGYSFYTDFGSFEPHITYLRNLKSERKAFSDSKPRSNIGNLSGVDKYKITSSLRYDYQDLTATLWMYYTPKYTNDYVIDYYAGRLNNPNDRKPVGSMTIFDLTVGYHITSDLRLNFAGRNIFDSDPPFVVVGGRPYDTGRYNAAGRTLSLELQYDF